MDADKRHQLKQNELAEALAKLRDFSDPRFIYALVAVAAIGLGVLAWYGWQYSRRHALEQGWQRLNVAAGALFSDDANRLASAQEDLRAMIADTKDQGLAGYARLELATSRISQAFRQPAQRREAFEDAANLLDQILREPQSPLSLRAAANFALASTHESLRQFDKAREFYKVLVDDPQYAAFAYKPLAEDRLANLDKLTSTVAFEQGLPPAPATQPQATAVPLQVGQPPAQMVPVQPVAPQPAPAGGEPQPAPQTPPGEPTPTPAPAPEPEPSPTP